MLKTEIHNTYDKNMNKKKILKKIKIIQSYILNKIIYYVMIIQKILLMKMIMKIIMTILKKNIF